ncbi:MAG: type II secretion system protein [Patescibacteria group bacterium]
MLKRNKARKNKGFTLIELLVVIAIIGILSSVVLASLNTAREKARDARRISDIKNLQLALELHADDNDGNYADVLVDDLVPTYISSIPTDPSTGAAYLFASDGGNEYHLGATLEGANMPDNDADCDSVGDAPTPAKTCFTDEPLGTTGFDGSDGAGATDKIYDQID